MGADNAMVIAVQQLGLIAATLVHGQEQQAQAMAQQAQAMAQQTQVLEQMQKELEKLEKLDELDELAQVSSTLELLQVQQQELGCAATARELCSGASKWKEGKRKRGAKRET
jgi:hypothetical protein